MGKEDGIKLVLVVLFLGGYVFLEDVFGVGKILLVKFLVYLIVGKF